MNILHANIDALKHLMIEGDDAEFVIGSQLLYHKLQCLLQ